MSQHAAHIARDHCLASERVDAPIYGGRYRSLFEDLPPLQADEEALHGLGRPGGPCDLGVDFVDDVDSSVSAVLPRNQEGVALIGDPRNDVHLFISQMSVAFIKLHNRLVDRVRHDEVAEQDVFEEARRAASWHYQHVILREFLPGLIGAQLTAELLDGGSQLYRAERDPYIPFEFADAAYRYGHAQIRDRYHVNEHFGPCPVFPDLMGFGPVPPEHTVDWALQIDVEGHARSKPGTDYTSLANRDLQRGQAVGLASGEAIAHRLAVPALGAEQVGLAERGWAGETPLWFYILKEAEVLHDGDRLGPVGGRIVGEVLVGIIDADPESFRSVDPNWTPTLLARRAGAFGLADILVPRH